MNKKVTKKDLFERLLMIEDVKGDTEMSEFIAKEIAALEKRAEKSRERAATKAATKAAGGDELRTEVFEILSETDFTAIQDIVATIGREDITPAKVTSRLTQLVKEGLIEKAEITVATGDSKRKVQGYRKIS